MTYIEQNASTGLLLLLQLYTFLVMTDMQLYVLGGGGGGCIDLMGLQ